MFTEDELKFLKRLVKEAREEKLSAATLVKNAALLGDHLADHGGGSDNGSIPAHSHKASVSLR